MSKQPAFPTSDSFGASRKFKPPIEINYIMKNGTREMVRTRHQCITALRMYEDKSFEELRYEHYRLTGNPSVLSTANRTTQQRIPSALNPSPVFPTPTITNEIAFPNPPCVNFSEAYANRLSNPATSAFTFSNPTFNSTTAGTPMFSTSNHESSALPFQRRANTTSFSSLRSTATAFNSTSATAYGNRLSNPATSAFTFSNPTFNSTTAGTPMFSTSNHESSALPFQRRANTTSFSSLRSTATAFNFTSATAYGNRLSNPATSAFTFSNPTLNSTNAAVGFGTHSPDVFTYPNSTTEFRCDQAASWNPQSNESMFSPFTSLPQCTICFDKERDIAFEPCGHLIICTTCVNQIGVLCPICRKVIKKKIKVYIS